MALPGKFMWRLIRPNQCVWHLYRLYRLYRASSPGTSIGTCSMRRYSLSNRELRFAHAVYWAMMSRKFYVVTWAVLGCLVQSGPSRACIDTTHLFELIHAQLDTVTACHDEARRLAPTSRGTLRLAFTISRSGAVTKAEATSDHQFPESLLNCAETATLNWKFPIPPGHFRVVFPVNLGTPSTAQ